MTHGAVASKAFGGESVKAALDNWRTAPFPQRVRETLEFLQKLTLAPAEVNREDILRLRACGIHDTAIRDAIHVCTVFSIADRVADALGFAVPDRDWHKPTASVVDE